MGKLSFATTNHFVLINHSDLYDVIMDPTLLPPTYDKPASYAPGITLTLPRPSTVLDICDFVVEYINSDVLVRAWLLKRDDY